MAKRDFLIPFAIAIAALVKPAEAAVPDSTPQTAPDGKSTKQVLSPDELKRVTLPVAGESKEMLLPSGDDVFKFVLRRSDDGQLVAQHWSHYSHSSHSSHSSHRSHYSSRY